MEGRTGYPLVDAGMRQLAAEGWMHNRARLVTASFLVKDLGIDWREGARHFFDLLLDGDVAQNVGNWQWVAGTGVDTRPNRVFNPTAQAKRLDPDGTYVRRWIPELADVPDPLAPGVLAPAYPAPIVDHGEAVAAFRARRAV
jgi:deoxyribodipyrimidine photo-lyase